MVQWYVFFFFFKQKTAYEIGTGDWSSDVCSSDLIRFRSCRSSNESVFPFPITFCLDESIVVIVFCPLLEKAWKIRHMSELSNVRWVVHKPAHFFKGQRAIVKIISWWPVGDSETVTVLIKYGPLWPFEGRWLRSLVIRLAIPIEVIP